MLFADASTGSHSPALVRQGQIAELINAKPKARRRILEEAAGISGLYQRRHEAELKLKGAEGNLARVDDLIEQFENQLQALAKQARQAKRYREIGAELRRAEGLLLYRRWSDAQAVSLEAQGDLNTQMQAAAQAERAALEGVRGRERAEEALPPCREEEAIARAILQRLKVALEQLASDEAAADETIAELERRIAQLTRDIEREAGLNADAEETIARMKREAADLRAAAPH